MTDREQFVSDLMETMGVEEGKGNLYNFCYKNAMRCNEEALGIISIFFQLMNSKQEGPYSTKWRRISRYLKEETKWIDPSEVDRAIRQLKAITEIFNTYKTETIEDVYAKCDVVKAVIQSVIKDLSGELKNADGGIMGMYSIFMLFHQSIRP